jgi:hypothetical protein
VTDKAPVSPALSVRFEVPRLELERFKAAATEAGEYFEAHARAGRFDETHLRGRVQFEVGVPFAPDPLLDFLRAKRGLAAAPPAKVVLDQPVAYLIGQLAGAAVLALHGEGEFSIPLTGGKGVVSVSARAGVLDLGLPLDQYAGIAPVPAGVAAAALAAAAESLHTTLASTGLPPWSVSGALERDARILQRVSTDARDGDVRPEPIGSPLLWRPDEWADGGGVELGARASEAQRSGARVVPYWRATRREGQALVEFAPVRVPTRRERRGTLALCIFPGEVRAIEVEVAGDEEGARKLRERLRRPTAFSARFRKGSLDGLAEPDRALPMA